MKTLATDLETPWGIYPAGLPVRVMEVTTSTLTVDLSPMGAGMEPRPYEIPRVSREWPASVRHGTANGFNTHVRRNQEPCNRCRSAWNYDQSVRRIESGRTNAFKVPVDAIADLYLSSSLDAQNRADKRFGPRLLDAVVRRFDDINTAGRVTA